MNAPPLNEFRSVPTTDVTDEKMDQVRELLLGDTLRRLEHRIAHLEARLQAYDTGAARKIEAIEARVESIVALSDGDRRATFEALSQAVADLGEQIRRISRG